MDEARQVKLVTEQKPLTLGDLHLTCAVGQCADGSYVDLLIGKKLYEVFGGSRTRPHIEIDLIDSISDKAEIAYVPSFLAAEGLRPFILPRMYEDFMPYIYKTHGITAYAYDVDVLRHICVIYSHAWRHESLLPQQKQIANHAIDLMESLMGVGLHGLVQEAVGWHRGDLHHLFERYLLELPSRYRQFFEDDYWRGAFALHGVRLHPAHKHPAWVKGFVYRSVYRYVPEVLHAEVSERNPVLDLSYRRKSKQFQYYSDEGKAKLHDQIIRVLCAGNKVHWRASRRYEFWDELAQICQAQQVIETTWEQGLQGRQDQGWNGLPLFRVEETGP